MEGFLNWIKENGVYEGIIQENAHSEIINRSHQLVKFLYDYGRIGKGEIEEVLGLAVRLESEFVNSFVHNFVIYLEYEDLETVFEFVEGYVKREEGE